MFVCNGNIHRSVIAAESLRKVLKENKISSKFLVTSCGLQGTGGTEPPKRKHLSEYPKEWKAAKPSLQKYGIDIGQHHSQKISEATVKKAGVIIAMDNKVYATARNSLLKQFPKYKNKIHRFSDLSGTRRSVKDPSGSGSVQLHAEIIGSIYASTTNGYEEILRWVK